MIIRYKEYLLSEGVGIDTSDLLNFINTNKGVNTYLHTCKTEELCKEIFEEGFEFVIFYNTTDPISPVDRVVLDFKLQMRKDYGDFSLIIQIPTKYMKNIEELTTKPPHENENGDIVYTLPKEFIKGYFNRKTAEIVKNPYFNLNYNSEKTYA